MYFLLLSIVDMYKCALTLFYSRQASSGIDLAAVLLDSAVVVVGVLRSVADIVGADSRSVVVVVDIFPVSVRDFVRSRRRRSCYDCE